jgi:hypothetical protein
VDDRTASIFRVEEQAKENTSKIPEACSKLFHSSDIKTDFCVTSQNMVTTAMITSNPTITVTFTDGTESQEEK